MSLPDSVDWNAVFEEALGYLQALLRIDTTNPPGNERPAAELIAGVLEREGIAYQLLESEPRRASVVARLTGSGAAAPLLLNAHLDVVPAEPQRWTHPPFEAVVDAGYVWGRGAIDMKNMAAMSLMTLILLKRRGVPLERDVIFAAVADEEAGSRHGSLFLVERHPELVRAEYVLGEVGGHTLHMRRSRLYPIQVAEKGVCWFEMEAHGPAGHGSMPNPASAVLGLARAVAALGHTRLPQHVTPTVAHFVRTLATHLPFAEARLLRLLLEPRLSGKLLDLMQSKNPEQAMALGAMLRNTATPTQLHAGHKVNVLPSSARATIDGRVIPGQTTERFLEEIRRIVGDEIELRVLLEHAGTSFPAATPLFELLGDAIGRHDPGASAVPYMIPGYTDAFAYARLGAICYGFSPVRLGPELNFSSLYHGHDERIPVAGFGWGVRVLYEVVEQFCRRGIS
jgi:acetylornithine deacetylase/succinyl-diaminopimelate desuccinylase-like protein